MERDFLKKHEHMGQVKPTELVNLGKWISPETEDGMCVFLNRETKKCVIYPDRPQVCRDYGQVSELQCPYIDLKGNRRSPAKVKRMQRQMKKQMKMQLRYLRNIVELKKSF